MWGGGGILYSLCPVSRLVGRSIYNLCPLYNSFTNGRISFKLEWHMCHLKVKVTVKGQISNKQILHIMSCPLYISFTNSFKLEWHIHLN